MLKFLLHFLVFLFLTALTQVGGIIYLIVIFIGKRFKLKGIRRFGIFFILYLSTTIGIVPFLSPFFGRTALPVFGNLRPLNYMTFLLNRNYVRPELKVQLISIADIMNEKFEGTQTNYLDANFPFIDGFPLLPHLSHSDGKKVDLAFYYKDKLTGKQSNNAPSFIGYGIFEGPTLQEINYPNQCLEKGYWQYNILSYLVPKWNKSYYEVDVERTKEMIRLLSDNELTSKIFIEPHLKIRWGLSKYDKIRFHGCQAVRHDDHIHTQIR